MHCLFVRPARAERDIPNMAGGPFTGVVHGLSTPRSEAQPKASRVLCGTGLDGSWSPPVPSSRFGMARFQSPGSLLLTGCRFAL